MATLSADPMPVPNLSQLIRLGFECLSAPAQAHLGGYRATLTLRYYQCYCDLVWFPLWTHPPAVSTPFQIIFILIWNIEYNQMEYRIYLIYIRARHDML